MSSIATISRQGGRRYRQFGSTPSIAARPSMFGGTSFAQTFNLVILTNDAYVAPSLSGGGFVSPDLSSESSVMTEITGEAWEGQ